MTDLYREYNPQTRRLSPVAAKYAGQAGDSLATVLHFTYTDPTYPNIGTGSTQRTPFIIFDVIDSTTGQGYLYTTGSTPAFDGYTFAIPWEVTVNCTNNRVGYQIAFINNTTSTGSTVDIAQLISTSAELSAIDTIGIGASAVGSLMLRESIVSTFTNDNPTLWGWVEYFKQYGLVVPVTYDNEQTLGFKTYNGTQDLTVALNMPYLDANGYIVKAFIDPIYQLYTNLVTAWEATPDDTHYPSEKLVKDNLDLKTDGTLAVWPWSATLTYAVGAPVTQGGYIYLSTAAANVGHDPAADDVLAPAYWVRVDTALDIVTAWQNVTSDTKLPSEKLVKASLDLKTDGLMAVWAWDAALTYQTGATVIYNGYEYVSLADNNLNLVPTANPASWRQMFTTDRIVTAWETVLSDGKVPSEKLVRDWFDLYTLGLDGLWAWNATATYKDAAVVTDNYTIYISLADDNTGHDPLEEGSAWWIKVQGGGGGSGGVSVVTRLIGNGTDTAYTVQHGLGTRNFVWSLRRNDNSNAFYTDASVTATTLNTCTVTFRNPPAANAYMLVLVPGGGTLTNSGQYTFEQTTAAAVWSIAHNLDKLVTVQTYDGDGNQILGDLKLVDTNNCTVTFTNAHTGTAAVR